MASENNKQMILAAVVGLLASGAVWYSMGGKRTEFEELKASNEKLVAEVDKGIQLKASYESLKKEVEEQENRIAELIKLFPLENERARVGQMVQRLAHAAQLGQLQSHQNALNPVRNEYHLEYSSTYKYLGGFREFGNFLSFVSGYDKIINISDIVMAREMGRNNNIHPVSIEFRLLVFVYSPNSLPAASRPATAAPAARQPAG